MSSLLSLRVCVRSCHTLIWTNGLLAGLTRALVQPGLVPQLGWTCGPSLSSLLIDRVRSARAPTHTSRTIVTLVSQVKAFFTQTDGMNVVI